MISEFLGCLFYVFTILQAFPSNKLLPNKPDALCDKPINSVASQPNNSVFVFYIQRLLFCLLIIYSEFIHKGLFNIQHLFTRLLIIYSAFVRKALFNIKHLLTRLLSIYRYLFSRHQVALLCTVSNICCRARPCPRAYFCQHRISIPCVPRSMGSFPISLCRHKVKHLLFSTPTFEIENLVKRKYRNP